MFATGPRRRKGLEFVCFFEHDRVGSAHVPYRLTYFGSDAWSSRSTPSALPRPISSEPTTGPADDRLRFHDDIEGTGNSREFKRFLSLTHVLLVVAIIIWEGRLRLY